MKLAAVLSLPCLASAFVAPAPKMARGRAVQMAIGTQKTFPFAGEPGSVKFFPDSAPYWDPMGLSTDVSPEYYRRLQHGEIKNGRVAMLAVLHYVVQHFGIKFPFMFGGISTADIPMGLGALKALPAAGWLQIIGFLGILEARTEPNEGNPITGKVPGNVQPDTPMFKAPGDVNIRTKEVNNGRLAMMAILGIWANEFVTGDADPFHTIGL